jgi:DNA invertase Pin-like site-specific DNA recombinase
MDTTALCEVKGWMPVGFYIDNDRSASNGHARPEWDRLLADIKADKIDAIAAWDQDRGWRLMHELEELRRFFMSLGREVKLATTGQGDVDLYSPTGVLAAQIKTAVSEHEVAMLKVRVRRAARERAEKGLPHWPRGAFGYVVEADGPQLDPTTAPLVAEAYRAIGVGASLGDICRLFNDAGAYGLQGKPWTPKTVSMFLRKPRNAALRAYGGEIIGKGNWPALIPESTWRATQAKLNAPERARGHKSVRRHLLTGLLGCGKCPDGRYLSGYVTKTGVRAYRCKNCLGVSIRAEQVEPLIYDVVVGRLAMDDANDLLKVEIHDEVEAQAIRTELNTLYGRLEEIGAERGEGLLTGVQAKAATVKVNGKIAVLERRQQDAERIRIFDGLELGTPKVELGIRALSPDRFRAVIDVLMTVTVLSAGKSGRQFRPERVRVDWK